MHDERKKLESMSMKVIDTMSKALAAKIPEKRSTVIMWQSIQGVLHRE